MEITPWLQQVAEEAGGLLDSAPRTLALNTVPAESGVAVGVKLRFTHWDAAANLSALFRQGQGCCAYCIRAAVYHIPPADGQAISGGGHNVAYIKQAQQWHLANDSCVSPVLMSSLNGLPHLLVLERTDSPGADMPPRVAPQIAKELIVENPVFKRQVPPARKSHGSAKRNAEVDGSMKLKRQMSAVVAKGPCWRIRAIRLACLRFLPEKCAAGPTSHMQSNSVKVVGTSLTASRTAAHGAKTAANHSRSGSTAKIFGADA